MQLKCVIGSENTISKVYLNTCLAHVVSVSETVVNRVNKPGCMLYTAYSAARFWGQKQGMSTYLPFPYILKLLLS